MKEGLGLIAVGVGCGIALSLLLTRAMSSLLFGIGTNDPTTLVAAGAFLISIAAAACFVPAWRACSIDPAQALWRE